VNSPSLSYGNLRERSASVSFAEIETAARKIMAAGEYPSVHAVRMELRRGSTTTIADAMRRFWKDQAALNTGNPVALTRLPPEFADAAVELWEQALRLSQQTAQHDDNAARAALTELRRDTDARARSLELREKEWDMAARVRERALAEMRQQVNILLKELANSTAELRANKARIVDLESHIEDYRRRLATAIARAVSRTRALKAQIPKSPIKPRQRKSRSKAVKSDRGRRRSKS
jgi:Plasmid replication region DNA-binding N-term